MASEQYFGECLIDPPMQPNDNNQLINNLIWYFNQSPGDMGFKSTYNAFLQQMWSPGHIVYSETFYTKDLLNIIARHRKIYQALVQLPKHQYRMLLALYLAEYQLEYPPIIVYEFTARAGLALVLVRTPATTQEDAARHLSALCTHSRHGTLTAREKHELWVIHRHVDHTFLQLHDTIARLLTP